MRTLYISYDGMTDPLGQSQVIPYLVGLSAKGHEITLISCEKTEPYSKLKNNISNILKTANIHWQPVIYSNLPSVFSKKLNLKRMENKAEEHCRKNKPELVHCRSYMAALIGQKLKLKYGVKFIFDMRGFWADERIEGNIWTLNNPIHKYIYKYFKKKEIEFLKLADYTISLTENAKKEILSWPDFKSQAIPIEVIPCCADLTLFSYQRINTEKQRGLKKILNINPEDFVLSYLGSTGTWYMLPEMLDFFKLLSEKKTNAKFLFITADNPSTILTMAKNKGISAEHLIIVKAQRDEVPLYLSLSNISLYFIKPVFSKKASSPTKTAEIMGMGIPIITNSGIGDSDAILNDSNIGLIMNEFANEEYIKTIDKIDVLLKTDKMSIRNVAEKHFSLERGVELYDAVYRNTIK